MAQTLHELLTRIHRHAARQHALTCRRQCLDELQMSPRQLRYLVDSGRLERVRESVYRVAGAPETHEQRLLAACWAGGRRGVVSHRSAAWLWRLPGAAPDLLEITGPRWRRSRHDGVIAHESHRLLAQEVTSVRGLLVTKPARTLLDLGAVVSTDQLQIAVQEAVRRQLASIPLLRDLWYRHGGPRRPGAATVDRVLSRWARADGALSSTGEGAVLGALRAHGYPDPVTQHELRLADGSRAFVDFAYPDFRVALEFDSFEYHGGRWAYEDTVSRRLRIEAAGWRVLSIAGDDLDAGLPLARAALDRHMRR